MEEDKGTVCVTGGTGFIASWLIKSLLEEGYSVHTTVRADPENKRDLSFLTNLPAAAEKLKIFISDLSDPDSFDAAIEGCKGVLHVATPIDFEHKEPEEVVIKRTISGSLGILNSCLKSKTVKRVVYTSSASAVMYNNTDLDMMDESFWSDEDFIRQNLHPTAHSYMISKTLTERAVLEFGAEHGLDVVTVVPSYVLGPFICPKFPSSVRTVLALVLGNKQEHSNLLNIPMVHVDDVARAHIFLLEYPEAKGRYNCSSHTMSIQKMAEILSTKYHPKFPFPTEDSLAEVKDVHGLSSKKLLDTDFRYKYGVEEMFDGAIKCCMERGDIGPETLKNKELVLYEPIMVYMDSYAVGLLFLPFGLHASYHMVKESGENKIGDHG